MSIRNVAIIGGIHGNELIGIHLLKRWEQRPEEVSRPSFRTDLFLGNPKAADLNRRFIDEDLNRCFLHSALDSEASSYEALRAADLNRRIGPKGASEHDLIIDLHTTTSNSGVMIILFNTNPFNLRIAAYIQTKMPDAKIHFIPPSSGDSPYLNSICPRGLAVEIGPIPQGLLRADIFHLTNDVVRHGLDYAHAANEGPEPALPTSVEVFRLKEITYFPHEGGTLSGYVHGALQDADYQALHPGDALFEMLDGRTIPYEGSETVYPVFINEAAYYYKNIAMSLCTRERLDLRE